MGPRLDCSWESVHDRKMAALWGFVRRLFDHWFVLMGALLMIEPIVDYHVEGFKAWADKYVSRKLRTRVAISISVIAVFVSSFLAFCDEFDARGKAIVALSDALAAGKYWKGRATIPSSYPAPTSPLGPTIIRETVSAPAQSPVPPIIVRVTPDQLLPQRHLSDDQKDKLKNALLNLPKHGVYFVVVTEGLPEQQRYALDFVSVLKLSGFLQSNLITGVSKNLDDRGLMVGLKDNSNPSPLAKAFMGALKVSGIDFKITKMEADSNLPDNLDFDLFVASQ